MLAVVVLETTSVIQLMMKHVTMRMAKVGNISSTASRWPNHLDRPETLDASDRAKPLPVPTCQPKDEMAVRKLESLVSSERKPPNRFTRLGQRRQ